MSIYKKILAVQKAAKAIKKEGYNSFHKYSYATEADVLEIKDLMNEHGLIAFPSVVGFETIQRGDKTLVLQHIKYTVVDTDTNEQIESFVLGSGEDNGDKGAYKAYTGANKYFYLKFAGAPTGDDPEKDEAPKTKKPAAVKPLQPKTSAYKEAIESIVSGYGLTHADQKVVLDHFQIKRFGELVTEDNQRDAIERLTQIGKSKQQGKAV